MSDNTTANPSRTRGRGLELDLQRLLRPNIAALAPYHCARDEFQGIPKVALDANESPYDDGRALNRYPDPLQRDLKQKIAQLKGVRPTQIVLGNGSDEVIDLLYRVFCRPGIDKAVAIEPTYGMYKVLADINDVEYQPVPLREAEDIDLDATLRASADDNVKLLWLCSPNNPTGGALSTRSIETLLKYFKGITIVDEAYIDFLCHTRWLARLDEFPRLVVMQTFSKAWAMAAARCGMCFATEDITNILNKVKYPYNVSALTQRAVAERLEHEAEMRAHVAETLRTREWFRQELVKLPQTRRLWHSDANFVLVRLDGAEQLYRQLVERGIITRSRAHVHLVEGSLRISIGTPEEMRLLLRAMTEILPNL